MNIESQKQELATTIIIEFLSKERKRFLGKTRIKKIVAKSDQKLENLIYEATNFESKVGPLMPTPWKKYFEASWFQIAEGKVEYNDKFFKKFSMYMLYTILKTENLLDKDTMYDFFSRIVTNIQDKVDVPKKLETLDELIEDILDSHKASFNQKSYDLQSGGDTRVIFN